MILTNYTFLHPVHQKAYTPNSPDLVERTLTIYSYFFTLLSWATHTIRNYLDSFTSFQMTDLSTIMNCLIHLMFLLCMCIVN